MDSDSDRELESWLEFLRRLEIMADEDEVYDGWLNEDEVESVEVEVIEMMARDDWEIGNGEVLPRRQEDMLSAGMWQKIKENDPLTTTFNYFNIEDMTDDEWEELGRDIANNTYLGSVLLNGVVALNDHKMSFLFRGLTKSSSIKVLRSDVKGLSVAGVRSMVPFLQNANILKQLYLDDNNIQSEGFNLLFRELRDSPIETLYCSNCGIESIEIDNGYYPKHLKSLCLNNNLIDASGCRELAKLLQGADSMLADLQLDDNQIHDEGVEIMVNALKNNTTLKELDFSDNQGITVKGMRLLLRLVNDVSNINATQRSNHTLRYLYLKHINPDGLYADVKSQIQRQIDNALEININHEDDPEAAGKEKVIRSQLHSSTRAELAELQGVDRSLYSEINPLHLPEVLALVGQHHGQEELYVALKSSIAGVISTVNRKECIQQQRAYYAAKLEELDTELATIEAAAGGVVEIGSESRSNKRRRS
jgi:hypothetical protein